MNCALEAGDREKRGEPEGGKRERGQNSADGFTDIPRMS